jgi:hypothetical protein
MKKGDVLTNKSGNEYIYDRIYTKNIHVFKTPFSKTVTEVKLLIYPKEPINGMFGEQLYKKNKNMATKKIDTTAELRAEMRKNGVRLPHGYAVVKRKPAKKKTTAVKKKKTVPGSTAKKRSARAKKPTAKQTTAQKKFASNAKRAAALVRTGKAKNTKQAWKQLKMEF